MTTTLPYLLFQFSGVFVLLVRSRPRGLQPHVGVHVRHEPVHGAARHDLALFAEYTAREQASEIGGDNNNVAIKAEIANVLFIFGS